MSCPKPNVTPARGTAIGAIVQQGKLGDGTGSLPTHGHAIARAIERNSEDVLLVEQGSLYPALHRLIKRGWILAEDGTSENNRRAKFYRLTAKGRRQLAVETNKWEKLAAAIGRILRPVEKEG